MTMTMTDITVHFCEEPFGTTGFGTRQLLLVMVSVAFQVELSPLPGHQ